MVGPRATSAFEPAAARRRRFKHRRPSPVQVAWLIRGLGQPGGKLPLFDENGRRYSERTVRSCIDCGWAEPWIANPVKPDWLVCKLTGAGRAAAATQARTGPGGGRA